MKKLSLIIIISLFTFTTQFLQSQWMQQTVPVSKPITGIKFIDSLRGWALSSSTSGFDTCYILNTSNSGTNWVVQHTATNSLFAALSVVDANIIYAGGGANGATANLHKTTNGGLNWILITTPTNMSIIDMVFLNKDSGWTVGASIGADVRTTTNGGLNWTVRISGIAQQTQKLFFLNYNTGFCGASTFLYKTTNAGMNWTLNSNYSGNVDAIFFLDSIKGWLGLSNGRIASTTNGGANWVVQQPFPLNTNITPAIYFVDSNTGYAGTGWFQKILKTTNGGINWGYQFVPTGSVRIAIVSSLNAWAADIGISHTTNGGGPITYLGISIISTEIPNSSELYQNYPNPFNPVTDIKYRLHKNSFVSLKIYDMLGKEIASLVNEEQKAGTYKVDWNAENYSTGVYYYRFITDDFTDFKKMILVK